MKIHADEVIINWKELYKGVQLGYHCAHKALKRAMNEYNRDDNDYYADELIIEDIIRRAKNLQSIYAIWHAIEMVESRKKLTLEDVPGKVNK